MTSEDVLQELERQPFAPVRFHLSSGQTIDVKYASTAWVRQNTLLIVHPLRSGTQAIGNYDVTSLRLIERIEPLSANGSSRKTSRRKKS
jgi:hypothetical protein